MATKKKVTKEVNAAEAEKKAAKRKARLEAIKNRPEGQRPNGKQIDVIETGNGVVKNYGYPLKNKDGHQGVLVTSVLETKDGDVIAIRQLMFMSHSYDHRVVDGSLGGMFLKHVHDYLQNWDMNTEI